MLPPGGGPSDQGRTGHGGRKKSHSRDAGGAGPDRKSREKEIRDKNRKVVLAVYKPAGIVCTESPKEKRNIIRYLNYPIRITYAGRLDKDSEGLLIMTNDGDLINGMMRARFGHEKEYKVTVDRPVTDEFFKGHVGRGQDPGRGKGTGCSHQTLSGGGGREIYIFHHTDPGAEPSDPQDVRGFRV